MPELTWATVRKFKFDVHGRYTYLRPFDFTTCLQCKVVGNRGVLTNCRREKRSKFCIGKGDGYHQWVGNDKATNDAGTLSLNPGIIAGYNARVDLHHFVEPLVGDSLMQQMLRFGFVGIAIEQYSKRM